MSGYYLSMLMPGWKRRPTRGWKRRPTRVLFARSLLFLVTCASLAGCLADNSPIMQVVPRLVLAPQNPRFQAINYISGSAPPSGTMLVKWNRSIADTQLNFKGYFVELWQSDTAGISVSGTENLVQLLDSVHIGHFGTKIPDTSCTFSSIPTSPNGIPLGRYTIIVKGEKTADTETLSTDSSQYSALYDPLPLSNPTNLQATSLGPTSIGLHWTPSPDDTSAGFYRYVLYYRDTTKNDTGHILVLIPKRRIFTDSTGIHGWDDSTVSVGVPGFTGLNQTTTEWPYKFWIKSERIDSTFFYGGDTNSVVWAGAERVPRVGNDTGANAGYLRVYNNDTIYFGSLDNQFNVAVDSLDNKGQVAVSINGTSVTLSVNPPYSMGFLDRVDQETSLDSVFYSSPLNDPSLFDQTSITLPTPTSGGAIVYVMMNDEIQPSLGHLWARIFIRTQLGNFINPTGAIDIKASFQPGVSKDGSEHLPFY